MVRGNDNKSSIYSMRQWTFVVVSTILSFAFWIEESQLIPFLCCCSQRNISLTQWRSFFSVEPRRVFILISAPFSLQSSFVSAISTLSISRFSFIHAEISLPFETSSLDYIILVTVNIITMIARRALGRYHLIGDKCIWRCLRRRILFFTQNKLFQRSLHMNTILKILFFHLCSQ